MFRYFNEFYFRYKENKNYPFNFIAGIIDEFIFISGIILTLSTEGKINPRILLYLCLWFIFRNAIFNSVDKVETDIRTDNIINLFTTRTDLSRIYMKKALVYQIEALVIFGISIIFYCDKLDIIRIPLNKLILAGILLFIFGIFVLKIFINLTFIWERTMTFVSFILSLSLIFGSKFPIVREINRYLLDKDINFVPLLCEIIIFVMIFIVIKRKSIYKIKNRGF